MQDNVLRRSGKCCATVRGMFLCGEAFVDEAGGVMHNRFFLIPHVNILQLQYNSFNLPLSGYKALVNKSSGETFILEENSGRAVPLVCASSGLQSIFPSALVTSYLAAQSELERFMTSGISKSVSNGNLAEITTVANKYTNSFFSKCCGRTSAESVSRIADEKFGFFAGSGKC